MSENCKNHPVNHTEYLSDKEVNLCEEMCNVLCKVSGLSGLLHLFVSDKKRLER